MMSTAQRTLLVELLTEELPPKALARLGDAFADGIANGLRTRGLTTDASVVTPKTPHRSTGDDIALPPSSHHPHSPAASRVTARAVRLQRLSRRDQAWETPMAKIAATGGAIDKL